MNKPSGDVARALSAGRAIIDGRDYLADLASVLVTLEHAISAVLLSIYVGDAQKAVTMLNEGVLPGVEARIAMFANKQATP